MEFKGFGKPSATEKSEKPLSKEALELAELARLEQELADTEAELARIEAQIEAQAAEAAKAKAKAEEERLEQERQDNERIENERKENERKAQEAEALRIQTEAQSQKEVAPTVEEIQTPKIAPIIVAQEGPLAMPKAPVAEPEHAPVSPSAPSPTMRVYERAPNREKKVALHKEKKERAPIFTKDRVRKAIKTAALAASLTLIPKEGQKDPSREHVPRAATAKEASITKRNPDTALFLSDHLKQSTDTTPTVSYERAVVTKTKDTVVTPKEAPVAVEKTPEALFPEHFGALEQHMNMEFFAELKTPAAKVAYLEWIREVADHGEKMHPYMPLVDKGGAMLTIIDKKGNPVSGVHNKPLILGRNKGRDGSEEGSTPAGFFWIDKSTNPTLLKEHPNLFEIRVPSEDGQGLEIDIHDTLYTLHSSLQSSVLNPEKKGKDAKTRRLSGGCLRIPGLDQGLYNHFLDAAPFKYKDKATGKTVSGYALPKIAILPEETAPKGIYKVLDRRSGKVETLTKDQLKAKIDQIISGKSLTK